MIFERSPIWLKGYQNGNYIEPSEQRLQEISIAKNCVAIALHCIAKKISIEKNCE